MNMKQIWETTAEGDAVDWQRKVDANLKARVSIADKGKSIPNGGERTEVKTK